MEFRGALHVIACVILICAGFALAGSGRTGTAASVPAVRPSPSSMPTSSSDVDGRAAQECSQQRNGFQGDGALFGGGGLAWAGFWSDDFGAPVTASPLPQ